jgi:hypothetical protein
VVGSAGPLRSATRRIFLVLPALCVAACSMRSCAEPAGLAPDLSPVLKGPDGVEYYLLDRGRFKAYYDASGRLQRIEYDSNGDGRPDVIAYHDGAKSPHLLEIDENFDGKIDRWEDYDPSGILVKVGVSRRGTERPDMWTFPGPGGLPARKEYDDNGDGLVDRVEIYTAGQLVKVELDTSGDGQMHRWQEWRDGHLLTEEFDIDGDGKPDRRIRYAKNGRIEVIEKIPHER